MVLVLSTLCFDLLRCNPIYTFAYKRTELAFKMVLVLWASKLLLVMVWYCACGGNGVNKVFIILLLCVWYIWPMDDAWCLLILWPPSVQHCPGSWTFVQTCDCACVAAGVKLEPIHCGALTHTSSSRVATLTWPWPDFLFQICNKCEKSSDRIEELCLTCGLCHLTWGGITSLERIGWPNFLLVSKIALGLSSLSKAWEKTNIGGTFIYQVPDNG